MRRALLLAMLVSAIVGAGGEVRAGAGGARTYAIVIGNNTSFETDLPRLKYADDDAARYYELFKALGAEVELFTVLDPESQERYQDLVGVAQVPRRDLVLEGIRRLLDEIEVHKAESPVLYFVFSGHGGVGRNYEGYMHLIDGPFTRTDLFEKVLARSKAAYNHVILDACQAYFLVASKGEGGEDVPDFRAAVRAYLEKDDIDRFPNTGVLLSSARDLETQEWSAYESGVFSHELLSALMGAADVDGDGKVNYSEVRAFLTAANQQVKDPRARLAILARPPAKNVAQPLLDLSGMTEARILRFKEGDRGRFTIEDQRGVRYADLNKAGEGEVRLRLIGDRDYYVRSGAREARVPGRGKGGAEVSVSDLGWTRSLAARGAVQDTFRKGLFAVAFGPTFYKGYEASTSGATLDLLLIDGGVPPPLPSTGSTLRPWAWTTLGIAVAAGIGAGVSGGLALQSFDRFKETLSEQGLADPDLMTEVENRRLATNALIAVSVASAAASLVLFLLEPERAEEEGGEPGMSLLFSPGPFWTSVSIEMKLP